MKIKRLLIVGAMTVGALGVVMPGAAQADCLSDKSPTTVEDKFTNDTCSGCGWIMIHGKYYPLFPC